MSNSITIPKWLVELSAQQQELLSGGQATFTDPILAPLAGLRGKPVSPLGKSMNDGSETKLGKITLQGATNSGPLGSIGNSNGRGEGSATGAEDTMILPPFFESGQTL